MEYGVLRLGRVIAIRMDKGEDVLANLEQVVKKENVQQGIIFSAIGTLGSCRVYQVIGTGYPAEKNYDEKKGPLEMAAIQGNIVDSKIHAHILFSDKNYAYAGHLEPGTKVQIIGEVFIGELIGAILTKEPYPGPGEGPKLLKVKPE
jgi:predicted DNA-binding protein with PD1-like motif